VLRRIDADQRIYVVGAMEVTTGPATEIEDVDRSIETLANIPNNLALASGVTDCRAASSSSR